MAARGDRTREQILDVAEQLLGDHGISNVSLSQIRIAANQKNERAVQYHFTDRDGVLWALFRRHDPRVQAIQDQLLADSGRARSMRRLVEVWARPFLEYVDLGPSERAWVKIVADLFAHPRFDFASLSANRTEDVPTEDVPTNLAIGMAVYDRLRVQMGPRLALDRILAVTQFVVLLAADRARLIDEPNRHRELTSHDEFVANMVAMTYAALTAKPPATPKRTT